MSVIDMRNDFLSFYNIPIGDETFYVKDKNSYKTEQVGKAVRIDGTLYKVTDPTRNSAHFKQTLLSAQHSFVDEKNTLLKYICDLNNSDTASVSMMFAQIANGLLTFFSDFVKLFARMPISEKSMCSICMLAGKYSTNTYNQILEMQMKYNSNIDIIRRNAETRLDNYNASTRAQFESLPTFSTFIGNSHTTVFGTTQIFGTFIPHTGQRQGKEYLAMAQNKSSVKFEMKNDISEQKSEAISCTEKLALDSIKSFSQELVQLIIDEIDDVFDYAVFCEKDLINRPYDGKLWKDKLTLIPQADWRKLKYLFDFYDISYIDCLQIPLFDKLILECGENGDFDAFDCREKDLYFFLGNYKSVKDDFYFGCYLSRRINERINEEFKKTDIMAIEKTDGLFADIYEKIENNQYLTYQQKSDIRHNIFLKRSTVREKRGY